MTLLILAALLAGSAHASAVFPEGPFSQRAAGTTAAAFLRAPNGARPQSLSGAVAAGADGAESVFWNPAGLARMAPEDSPELALSYGLLLESTYLGSGAYSRPTKNGAWAASFTYFGQSAQQGYTAQGDAAGEFTPYDLAVGGSYAHRFERFSAGGTLKLIRSVIDDESGTTAAVDFGMQARHVTMIGDGPADVGLSLTNLGPPLAMGASAPLPFAARLGLLWHASNIWHPAFDLNFPVDAEPYVSFGLEARFALSAEADVKKSVAIRAGYNQDYAREKDGLAGMTAGVGADLGKVRVDYAWAPYGDVGMTNRVTIALRF